MTANEEDLVRAAQRGEVAAYNQLVLEYQALAHNVAYHILGDSDSAADATQDSFLKAYRSLAHFRGGSFRAWLLTILTNTCYDLLRSRRRHPTRSMDELEATDEWAPWLTDRRERPVDYAERQELAGAIRRGIQRLPADQRTVMILSDVEGFSYAEIAGITGTTMGTVKSRLSRARARLRDFLIDQPDILPLEWRETARAGHLMAA